LHGFKNRVHIVHILIGALGAGGAGGPSNLGPLPPAGSSGVPDVDGDLDHKWGTVRHLCGVAVYQEEEVRRRHLNSARWDAQST
jgi:hypothetical protein